MNLETTLKAVKDYGVTGVLVVWLFMTNNRLSIVEDKLYTCYQTLHTSNSMKTQHDLKLIPEFIAILTKDEIKVTYEIA